MPQRLAPDPVLALLSLAWILVVIAVGEGARRVLHAPPELSRKVVHVGVGFWALPTALLFASPWWAAAVPGLFVILNAISYRYRLLGVIEEAGRGSPGTIYFPLSFSLLILCLWPLEGGRAASVAGLFAMGFGDAAASVVGRRWGRHPYRLGGALKSWEGSAAFLGVTFLAVLLGTWPLVGRLLAAPAAATALGGSLAEAPAGRGLDNLTVPIAGALVFLGLERLLG
jgi:phytol kinase